MKGQKKAYHTPKCLKDFPGCPCNRCARDGELVNMASCCVEYHTNERCGTFEECPAFVPEDKTKEGEL